MARSFEFSGSVIVLDSVKDSGDFASFVDQLQLKPPFVVKPNWINEELAHQTDPLVLSWLLKELTSKGETCVVEAYSARNQIPKGKPGESKLEKFRRTEREFLRRQGLDRVFRDLGVTYLNVDEELMAERIADPVTVRSVTESRVKPVKNDELYSFVPQALYDLRRGTMISFAKFKLTFSMCTKNIFGLIPEMAREGGRGSYHGKKDRMLPRSIVDINKIYRAVFNVVGLVEGVRNLTGFINRGPHHSVFGYDYEVYENLGLVYFGMDPLWLDAFICSMCGVDPRSYRTSVLPQSHLALGYRELLPWPKELEDTARSLGSPIPNGITGNE